MSPVEIEEAAMFCKGIKDCLCVAIEDPHLGQAPKLYVVLSDEGRFNKAEFFNEIRSRLEAYKEPQQIEIIDKIPYSSIGKKLRQQLT